MSLRYGTGAGVGIQYAETDTIREAIQTGVFTDRAAELVPRRLDQPAGRTDRRRHDPERRASAPRARRRRGPRRVRPDDGDGDGQPVTRTFGTVVNWTDDPWSRCIARAPIGDQRETLLPLIRAPLTGGLFRRRAHGRPPRAGRQEGAIKSAYRVAARSSNRASAVGIARFGSLRG